MTRCEWCSATANGDYNMIEFVNPENTEMSARLAVYGGKITMDLRMPGAENEQRMSCDINFCPFCGRSYTGGNDIG